MGLNSHIDVELSDRLEAMIEDGLLKEGTPAYGIARLVLDGGLGILTDKQRYVYDKFVQPLLYRV